MSWSEIKAEAFGDIGIDPGRFYKLTFRDYILIKKGFRNKLIRQERMFRELAFIMVAPYNDKKVSKLQMWPIDGDDEIKEAMKKHMEESNKKAMEILSQMKNLEYVEVNGRIIPRQINQN